MALYGFQGGRKTLVNIDNSIDNSTVILEMDCIDVQYSALN